MKVAAIQHDIVWENPEANFERLAPMIAAAAGAGARLAVLTEMFATGFSMATDHIAEPAGGPSESFLVAQAGAHDLWLCASVAELAAGRSKPTNQLLLCAPDGTVHRYAKIHPFTYGGEHERFDAGTEIVTIDIEGLSVTPFVCYDLRFADEFWGVAERTDLYVVPANWPAARRAHWQALLRARAIENQAFVVGVNRVGSGGGLDYAGDSQIIDPLGEVLASAAGTEVLLVADIEPDAVAATRARFPFLQDRR